MGLKTALLTVLGFFFLGMGAVGIALPIWPTTPFVLISVACFSGTPRIKEKIIKIRFFREHVENYDQRTGLSRKTLIISLSYLWGMLLISMVLIRKIWALALLMTVGMAVTAHLLFMARARDKQREDS